VGQSPWPSFARNWRLLILAEMLVLMLIPMLIPMAGARSSLRVTEMRVTLWMPLAFCDIQISVFFFFFLF